MSRPRARNRFKYSRADRISNNNDSESIMQQQVRVSLRFITLHKHLLISSMKTIYLKALQSRRMPYSDIIDRRPPRLGRSHTENDSLKDESVRCFLYKRAFDFYDRATGRIF